MQKKILLKLGPNYYSSLSDDESMIEARANFYLMAKEEKVYNNDFDDLDILQHEDDCLFI